MEEFDSMDCSLIILKVAVWCPQDLPSLKMTWFFPVFHCFLKPLQQDVFEHLPWC